MEGHPSQVEIFRASVKKSLSPEKIKLGVHQDWLADLAIIVASFLQQVTFQWSDPPRGHG